MGFFDVLPEPEPMPGIDEDLDDELQVVADWVGPRLGYIGADVDCRGVIARAGQLCLWLDRVVLYPNGLTIDLELQLSGLLPDGARISGGLPWAVIEERRRWDRPPYEEIPAQAADYFRFGVLFPDGQKATTGPRVSPGGRGDPMNRVRGLEPPNGLVMMMRGGSGGQVQFTQGLWLWPTPPSGPVVLYVAWPRFEIPETSYEISGEKLALARENILKLWPETEFLSQ